MKNKSQRDSHLFLFSQSGEAGILRPEKKVIEVFNGDIFDKSIDNGARSPLMACIGLGCWRFIAYAVYKSCTHGNIFHRESEEDRGLLVSLINSYQRNIRPEIINKFGNVCRYTPSCSQYALEAIDRYGDFRRGVLEARRIVRCNPLSSGGFHPVH